MTVQPLRIPDLKLIEPTVYGDSRGFFMETYREDAFRRNGIDCRFIQDNLSYSKGGVVRGLHFQNPHPQAKLVYVLQGSVYDVAVDVRKGSPTFGEWVGEVLSAENRRQLFIPEGFAHGFAVLSEEVLFAYKVSDVYSPESESTVLWNDPDLGIDWPIVSPVLSAKDLAGVRLRELPAEKLP